jgi:hypothetical protein
MLPEWRFENWEALAGGHTMEEEPGMDSDKEAIVADFLDREVCVAGTTDGSLLNLTPEEKSGFEWPRAHK